MVLSLLCAKFLVIFLGCDIFLTDVAVKWMYVPCFNYFVARIVAIIIINNYKLTTTVV